MSLLQIDKRDNVAVALSKINADSDIYLSEGDYITVLDEIPSGHKVALRDINKGEKIFKYGYPIGEAFKNILKGQWVHVHNLKTCLGEILEYHYSPDRLGKELGENENYEFMGYRRKEGAVGIRNEIWVIPTVSCVNRPAEIIADEARKLYGLNKKIDGIYEFKHPHGCSQIGDDHLMTQRILAGLSMHPNAGGVLIIGLGCENNHVSSLKEHIDPKYLDRIRFLVAQEVEDEIKEGVNLIGELVELASQSVRESCSAADLRVGLECGGSDAFSGITANPVVGAASDLIVSAGGTTVLTEVPEMFGAETILMDRALEESVFKKIVRLINNYKIYFKRYNQPVYENPSYGNKEGGLTTLEEKSLGCVEKGGKSPVSDVLEYGERITRNGLNLLSGPGNDIVSCTALAASGCQIILFTTGRGTPLGTVVPTVKIATNNDIYRRKQRWFDYNAGIIIDNTNIASAAGELLELIVGISGGEKTKNEELGFREIAILKDGVTC